jgi:Tfp pilus assembly protein PilF
MPAASFWIMTGSFLVPPAAALPLDERSFVEGLSANPRDIALRAAYGRWLHAAQRHVEAEAETRTAVNARPNDASLRRDLAQVLADAGDPRAADEFALAVASNPADAEVRGSYAAYLARRDPAAAEREFEALAEIGDVATRSRTLLAYADLVLQQRPTDLAAITTIYERACDVDSSAATLTSFADFLFGRVHDYPRAQDLYKRALENDAAHEPAVVGFANLLYVTRRDLKGASALLWSLQEPSVSALDLHARVLRSLHEFEKMSQVARQAVARDPTLAPAWRGATTWDPGFVPRVAGDCFAVGREWNAADPLACLGLYFSARAGLLALPHVLSDEEK